MWAQIKQGKKVFSFQESEATTIYTVLPGRGLNVQVHAPVGTCPALEEAALTLGSQQVEVTIYHDGNIMRKFDGVIERFMLDVQPSDPTPRDRLFIGVWKV